MDYVKGKGDTMQGIITLVTVIKSLPKNTPLTPSTLKSCLASGEPRVEVADGKSIVPDSRTGTPGINFRLLGLGVSCTRMNMVRTK